MYIIITFNATNNNYLYSVNISNPLLTVHRKNYQHRITVCKKLNNYKTVYNCTSVQLLQNTCSTVQHLYNWTADQNQYIFTVIVNLYICTTVRKRQTAQYCNNSTTVLQLQNWTTYAQLYKQLHNCLTTEQLKNNCTTVR